MSKSQLVRRLSRGLTPGSRLEAGRRSRTGLIVIDTSYPSWTIEEWGTWDAVTCRDLNGHFDRVITVNPLSSVAPGASSIPSRVPQVMVVNERHAFVDGTHSVGLVPRGLPAIQFIDFAIAQMKLIRRVVRWGREYHVSAVRAGDPLYAGVFSYAISRLLQVPLVVRVGGNNERLRVELGRPVMPRMFRWELAERRVERFVLSHASAVLPANDDYLEFAVRAGASRKACTVVRYGNLISAAHFVPPEAREEGWSLLNRWGIEPGTPLLLCVGRLEKLKRSEDVIDVSLKLWNQGRQFRCLIVGEGSDEDRLNEKINALGLDGVVVLCRNQSQKWLSRVLPCASAFVSPLTGRALTEAALAAAPVAAYAVDWQAELIIDGETGILAPLGDTAALARGVERLIDNPSHAAAMGRALRTKAMSMMDPSELNRVESSVYLDLVPPRHGATSREALTRVDQF